MRQAQGAFGPTPTDTVGALIDEFELSWPTRQRKISTGTQEHYRRNLRPIRKAWGNLPASDLRPRHVDALIRQIGANKPGAANNTLDALKAMVAWAMGPVELLAHDPTHGVERFQKGEGTGLGRTSNWILQNVNSPVCPGVSFSSAVILASV